MRLWLWGGKTHGRGSRRWLIGRRDKAFPVQFNRIGQRNGWLLNITIVVVSKNVVGFFPEVWASVTLNTHFLAEILESLNISSGKADAARVFCSRRLLRFPARELMANKRAGGDDSGPARAAAWPQKCEYFPRVLASCQGHGLLGRDAADR